MRNIIAKYKDETVNNNSVLLLAKEQAIDIFNLLVEGKTHLEIKHILFIPVNKIKNVETKFLEIRDMVERLVKRECFLAKAEYDISEETGEQVLIKEAVTVPSPSSLEKLIERSIELIGRDYDFSEPLFQDNNVDNVVDAIKYIVNTIVIKSNETNDATFDWWKSKVISL